MSSLPPYLPTEDEIREACRQIRAGWSATEERSRRWSAPPAAKAGPAQPDQVWIPPVIAHQDVFGTFGRS